MASSRLRLDIFSQPGVTSPRVAAAVEALASQSGIEVRGAIFTRAEVVDFKLDLAGYTEDRPLHRMRTSHLEGEIAGMLKGLIA